MKHRTTIVLITLALLLAPAARSAAIPPGVTVSIAALDAGPYLPEIPIPLVVEVRNTTAAAVSVPALTLSGRNNPYHSVSISVGRDGDALAPVAYVVPNFGPWKEGLVPAPPESVELAPAASLEVVVVLSNDWQPREVKPLLAPGALRVQATYRDFAPDGQGRLVSDTSSAAVSTILALPIANATGPDAEALQLVRASEHPWLLAHPAAVEHIAQGRSFRQFQEIANLGSGVYSRYAAAVVAYMFAEGNGLDLNGARPAQPAVARQWLDKAKAGAKSANYPPDWIRLEERLGTTP